ncbi:MAG: DUF4118 domain-containing protein [Microthrixaceae bacterium]
MTDRGAHRGAHRGTPAAVAGSVAALATAAVFGTAERQLHPANVALLLMLVVIGAAAVGGRRAGVVTAAVAALSFNFFTTEPVHTLRIEDAGDLLSFVLLLAGGLAVGQLAHVAAERGRRAARHELGIRRLHELAELVGRGASNEVLLDRATRYLTDELYLRSCDFRWGDGGEEDVPALAHDATLAPPLQHAPGGFALPDGGLALPVTDGDTVVGRFTLHPSPGRGVSLADRRVAVLVGDVLAPALASRRPEP